MAAKNPFRVNGKTYDLTSEQVAEKLDVKLSWVRDHAEALGGLKRPWRDGPRRPATWRFPSKGLVTKAKAEQTLMKKNQARKPKAA